MFNSGGDDDHLYDFNTSLEPNAAAGPLFRGPQTAYRAPGTSSQRPPMSSIGRAPGSRMGTSAGGGGEPRPMTSVSGAGYQSSNKENNRAFDPLNMGKGPAPPLAEKSDNSPEDKAKEMERGVHRLIEASADAVVNKDMKKALEKAKEAGKAERALCKFRESHGLAEHINLDLTYAICFNLANAYYHNGLYEEALNTYQLIVKNKQYPQSGRLRVNMGNIYHEQKKYPQAIKMYRMALDQIPSTGKELRYRIFRNIGNAFIKLGQFQDAVESFESVMAGSPDIQTAFNLMLCHYARGDKEKMRRHFVKMLSIPIPGMTEEDEEKVSEALDHDSGDAINISGHNERVDALREELKIRNEQANENVLAAARLIAPIINVDDSRTGPPDDEECVSGYKWVMEQLRPEYELVASKLEIDMAMMYMKKRKFDEAIDVFKQFERKDASLMAMAGTNLSFIYFLEEDYGNADKHADRAIKADRYNAKALVNKGNCMFISGEYGRAKEMYLEAVGVEADCVEAIYNLGLANLKLNAIPEAQQAFDKLYTILPSVPEALFQIGAIYERYSNNNANGVNGALTPAMQNDLEQAAKTYEMLLHRMPSDPQVCNRLGLVYERLEDENTACHWQTEAHRHYPVNLNVISWLGVWYVKREMYEQAIEYFQRAALVQPSEVKWRLMVTSCYRRLGDFYKALELYQKINEDYPDNTEALQYLEALCKDLGKPHEEYSRKLDKLRRAAGGGPKASVTSHQPAQQPAQQRSQRPGQGGRSERPSQDEDMGGGGKSPMAAPRVPANSGGRAPPPARPQRPVDDDDDFGDTDVNDLLG